MTPKDGNIQSNVVLLNGTSLKLIDSLDIHNLEQVLVGSSSSIRVVPKSFVFVVLKDFKADTFA